MHSYPRRHRADVQSRQGCVRGPIRRRDVSKYRLASAFQQRPPNLAAAADLIDAHTVLSLGELDKGARLVEAAADRGEAPPEELVAELRRRAEDIGALGAAETLSRL